MATCTCLVFPLLEVAGATTCFRWCWTRCARHGSKDSQQWVEASIEDIEEIKHYCCLVSGAYATTLDRLQTRTGIESLENVTLHVDKDSHGRVPPHYMFTDHARKDIVLCIRGLNLLNVHDYVTLADTRIGSKAYDGGFVHRGLFSAAKWLMDHEGDRISELLKENGDDYTFTLVGHSLGAGVASLFAILMVNNAAKFDNIDRARIRCFAIAPARCTSINLAVRYSDIIRSIVLQDDFLPRSSTPIMKIFLLSSLVFTVLVLLGRFWRDTCTSERKMLADPKRLYPPGKLYHIVYKEACNCSSLPPVVRVATPVEGRFERLVLSCTTTSDHHVLHYQVFAEQALQNYTGEPIQTMPPAVIEMKREFDQRKREHLKRYDIEKLRSKRMERKGATAPAQAVGTAGGPIDDKMVEKGSGSGEEEGVSNFVTRLRRSLTMSRSLPQ